MKREGAKENVYRPPGEVDTVYACTWQQRNERQAVGAKEDGCIKSVTTASDRSCNERTSSWDESDNHSRYNSQTRLASRNEQAAIPTYSAGPLSSRSACFCGREALLGHGAGMKLKEVVRFLAVKLPRRAFEGHFVEHGLRVSAGSVARLQKAPGFLRRM